MEYGIRLIKIKIESDPQDLSWQNIVDLLDLKVHKDSLRKACYTDFGAYNLMKYFTDNYKMTKNELNYIKVIIMNDLHIPYHKENVFDEIAKHKDADYLIFNGDLVDCASCSSFPSLSKPSFEEELVILHEFITKVNTIIDPNKTKIIANRGNHEFRYTRDIMKMQEKHLSKMLNPNMLSMIEEGFTVYEESKSINYKPITNFTYVNDFYIRLFDNLIVAHPIDFSGVEGSMLTKVADYFLNEGIAHKDDVIAFGHTHKMMMGYVNRRQGVYVIENGCLCQDHEYSKMGKLSFTPQNYGYCVLKFKKGCKIDINDINVVHLK